MALKELIALLDSEIAALEQARAVLVGGSGAVARKAGPSPKTENTSAAESPITAKKKKKKRNLTPEGRARIGAAVKRYWAARKKTAK
jgi:hypothetical protein